MIKYNAMFIVFVNNILKVVSQSLKCAWWFRYYEKRNFKLLSQVVYENMHTECSFCVCHFQPSWDKNNFLFSHIDLISLIT